MEPASLQETSVILEHEMKDDPDSLDISQVEEEELDEYPAAAALAVLATCENLPYILRDFVPFGSNVLF